MKALKVFLILAMVSLFAVGAAISQTVQEKFDVDFKVEVECNGDVIEGPATVHLITHANKDGNSGWMKAQVNGDELCSLNTDEIFKISFIAKLGLKNIQDGVVTETLHYNLIGNMGTHILYSVTYEIDITTGDMTIISEKSKCL